MDGSKYHVIPGTFSGNDDRNTKVEHYFDYVLAARYIKLLPQTWQGWPSMRAAVLVCEEISYALATAGESYPCLSETACQQITELERKIWEVLDHSNNIRPCGCFYDTFVPTHVFYNPDPVGAPSTDAWLQYYEVPKTTTQPPQEEGGTLPPAVVPDPISLPQPEETTPPPPEETTPPP
jgi:hypothetical protein